MAGHEVLVLRIGVRVPIPEPTSSLKFPLIEEDNLIYIPGTIDQHYTIDQH